MGRKTGLRGPGLVEESRHYLYAGCGRGEKLVVDVDILEVFRLENIC